MKGLFYLLLLINFTLSLKAEVFNSGKILNIHGKKNQLAEDEGYLYLSLNTLVDITKFSLNPVGFGKNIKFDDIKIGQNHALLKVKAGEYFWQNLQIYTGRGMLRNQFNKDDYHFTVKPGVVNYPGTWSFSAEWVGNYKAKIDFDNYNYASQEIAFFQNQFKDLSTTIEFVYQGQIEDPYSTYLTTAIKAYPSPNKPDISYALKKQSNLPMTFIDHSSPTDQALQAYPSLEAYMDRDIQRIWSASPNENFLLFSSNHDDIIRVGLINIKTYHTYLIYQQQLPKNTVVKDLAWVDNNTFFLTISNSNINRSYVAHLEIDTPNNTIEAKFLKFRKNGYLVDALKQQNNQLLFMADIKAGLRRENSLYKVDITDEKSMDDSFRKIYTKTKKMRNIVDLLVDNQGKVRAVITADFSGEKSSYDYWFLPNDNSNKWRKIKNTSDAETVFFLQALSADETSFYVISNQFGDKFAIHRFSTVDGSHQGLFFEDPEHDIQSLKIDKKTQKITGYSIVENGIYQVKYFNKVDDSLFMGKTLAADLQLYEIQTLETKNKMMMFGISPDSQGAWFILDKSSGEVEKIFDRKPEYEKLPKGKSHLIQTQAADGVNLEGYLLMPDEDAAQAHPLVVIPHGGPIGIRDYANNDTMQHFFASQGIATLKVNYRGSGGFGKKFEELGKGQWGEKIEQDIHTMVQHVKEKYAIDTGKICSLGGSYGGYSALMLTYLYPETYRCAISVAGVMDLPLMFTSKDLSRNTELFNKFAEIVGDPRNNITELVNKSPLYLVNQIKRPFLIFQGMEDTIVRPEQALRMQQMIQLNDSDNQVILFKDEGHSFKHANIEILYLAKSLDFIRNVFAGL